MSPGWDTSAWEPLETRTNVAGLWPGRRRTRRQPLDRPAASSRSGLLPLRLGSETAAGVRSVDPRSGSRAASAGRQGASPSNSHATPPVPLTGGGTPSAGRPRVQRKRVPSRSSSALAAPGSAGCEMSVAAMSATLRLLSTDLCSASLRRFRIPPNRGTRRDGQHASSRLRPGVKPRAADALPPLLPYEVWPNGHLRHFGTNTTCR